MSENQKKPSPVLEVEVDGKVKTLRMPFARLNRLLMMMNGGENVLRLANDDLLQEAILLEVFTDREKGVVIYKPDTLDELDFDANTANQILDWVTEHITDFFLRRVENQVEQTKKSAPKMQSLVNTATGIAGSLSKTLPVSPSDASQPIFGT